ncbi:MAG: hypothetical protein ACE5EI_09365 [Thermodesulfobacteriota bacterium]
MKKPKPGGPLARSKKKPKPKKEGGAGSGSVIGPDLAAEKVEGRVPKILPSNKRP